VVTWVNSLIYGYNIAFKCDYDCEYNLYYDFILFEIESHVYTVCKCLHFKLQCIFCLHNKYANNIHFNPYAYIVLLKVWVNSLL